ncbi:hypothetical protein [Pseudovibrio sp. Ad26]|uniref:hypothetical protein n=1 Tax=Pseudovibrio sp. Ad26 TaxID=989410 RepID=UPI0007AEE114|nr:hypothetical protein [Pseudovibrio sp. Ad26]KZL06009.1 hypothetical protein PsAD26_04156 [Pseudovibrio sp. Ad26]
MKDKADQPRPYIKSQNTFAVIGLLGLCGRVCVSITFWVNAALQLIVSALMLLSDENSDPVPQLIAGCVMMLLGFVFWPHYKPATQHRKRKRVYAGSLLRGKHTEAG